MCCQSVRIRKAHTSHICSLIPVKQYHFILKKLLCLICFQSSWHHSRVTEESLGPWLAKSVRGWLATWCRRACLDSGGLSMDRGLCRDRDFGREGNQGNHRNMTIWKRGEVNLKVHRDSWWIAIFRALGGCCCSILNVLENEKDSWIFHPIFMKSKFREAFDGFLVSQSCKPRNMFAKQHLHAECQHTRCCRSPVMMQECWTDMWPSIHLYSYTWAEYKDPTENLTVRKIVIWDWAMPNASKMKSEFKLVKYSTKYPDMYCTWFWLWDGHSKGDEEIFHPFCWVAFIKTCKLVQPVWTALKHLWLRVLFPRHDVPSA